MGEIFLLGMIAGLLFYAAIALPEGFWPVRMVCGYGSLILFGLTVFSIFFPEIAELTLDIMRGMVLLIKELGKKL